MEILSKYGAQYRTQLLTQEHAEQFAACVRGNPAFDGVTVLESDRAKGERRWFVTYSPKNPEAREALLQRQQDKRAARAEAELDQYLIVPDEGGRFYWVQSASGEVYEVTPFGGGCTCPDHEHRCREAGIRCKHQIALEQAIERGTDEAA